MWSFSTQFFNNANTLHIPQHFTFLILYILASSLILCNFILPLTISTQNQINPSRNLKIPNTSEFLRAASGNRRKEPRSTENVSRRSNPTQVWPGGEKNRLFYHWIPNMKEIWDEGSDIYWPWRNSTNPSCQPLNVHFALENTFPPLALVSYPGSGSSWLRYLLECTTGIFTGSIFKDRSLYAAGLLGEFNNPVNNGRTILQKSHHDTATGLHPPKFKSTAAFRRRMEGMLKISELIFGYSGILLVRNPFDAIFSYWNYVHTKNHKAHAELDLNFPEFLVGGAEKWAGLIQTWVKRSKDFLIVAFEDLVEDPKKELNRILNYLNVPPEETRMDCALQFSEGPFHRKHSASSREGALIDWNHIVRTIQLQVDTTNKVLRHHSLPPLDYTFENSRLQTLVSDTNLP